MKKLSWKRCLCLFLSLITLAILVGEPMAICANAATIKITATGLKDLKTEAGAGVHLSGSIKSTGSKIYSIQASVSGTNSAKR